MKRKEKILNLKQKILNKVRFHAPVCYSPDIDRTVLFNRGVDPNLPIFVYDNVVNKDVLNAFMKALGEERFNLLLPYENLTCIEQKRLENARGVTLFSKNDDIKFLNMITKLNINYSAKTDYNIAFKDKFCKIDGVTLNPQYREFFLCQNVQVGEVEIEYKEFLLNGNNIYVVLKNRAKNAKKINFLLNFPLKRGYFLFKKKNSYFSIDNLQSGERLYFNYVSPKFNASFSMIDGLDNSLFATIFLKLNFLLKPNEEKVLFFNLSNRKLPLKRKCEFDKLFALSIKKNMEIFDVRVKTKNHKFDQFFNNTLPKKVWLSWLNFEKSDLVEKYLTYRSLFVRGKEKLSFVPFEEIGLKEVGVFNGEYYKKILVSFCGERFLQVGKTKFFNITNITRFSLKKNEAINLSF